VTDAHLERSKIAHIETRLPVLDLACKANALALDNAAKISRSTAKYLASAKVMSACIAPFSPVLSINTPQEVMQLHALSVLNYIKGGDVNQAKVALAQFKSTFKQQDLYFSDYTSFTDTATALLAVDSMGEGGVSSLNISTQLKAELKRRQYWMNH
jgi:hypothetical protein